MSKLISKNKATEFTQKTLYSILGRVSSKLNDGPGFTNCAIYNDEYFYDGNTDFLSQPAKNSKWQLGYAYTDLTPYNFKEYTYYLGGYLSPDNGFKNTVEKAIDKMQCRVISLDDSSNRGISVFAVIDCIGTGNKDIKLIRRKFSDLVRINCPDKKINTVNVFSTHTHSCIDTQGLWTNTFYKLRRNYKKNKTGKGTYLSGTDSEYMSFMTTAVANAMLEAVLSAVPGEISFAKKDIGSEYFSNKNRKSATALSTELLRFVFTPDDKQAKPTVIASFPAHPDVAGLPTSDGQGTGRELSGDYIYYMGEYINRAGYNFLFINGAICAIYMSRGATNDGLSFEHRYEQSIRYGTELAKITLALTKSVEQIENDPLLFDKENTERDIKICEQNHSEYTLWYKNWQPVIETPLPPCINIKLAQVKIPVTNPLIQIVGKLNLASYSVISEKSGYYLITETGFIELGNSIKIVMVPGEFCQDLLLGGNSLTEEGSYNGIDFYLPPINEVYGKDIYAFGLANDAIGYIVPDNDYVLGEFGNHYHEIISLGIKTGSRILESLYKIYNTVYGRTDI